MSCIQGQYQIRCHTTKVGIRLNVMPGTLRSVSGQISYNQGLYLDQVFYLENFDKKCWYIINVFMKYLYIVFIIAVCAL